MTGEKGFMVTSMGAGGHDVYFDVAWQIEPGRFHQPILFHTASVLMNTERSAGLRAEAQAVADRFNEAVGPDFNPSTGYREIMMPLAVDILAGDIPGQIDRIITKLTELAHQS